MKSCKYIAIAASSFLLAACANKPPATQDVTVSLASLPCEQEFTRDRSTPIALDLEKPVTLELEVQRTSPCKLNAVGDKHLYEVVTLPTASVPYQITVSSPKIGGSAFAPAVVLLGQSEDVRRVFEQDAFLNRGSKLALSFEGTPDDRYLVISSNADVVGNSRTEIQTVISTQSQYNAGFGTTTNLYFGSEQQSGYTFSHTGKVTVTTMSAPDRTLARNVNNAPAAGRR